TGKLHRPHRSRSRGGGVPESPGNDGAKTKAGAPWQRLPGFAQHRYLKPRSISHAAPARGRSRSTVVEGTSGFAPRVRLRRARGESHRLRTSRTHRARRRHVLALAQPSSEVGPHRRALALGAFTARRFAEARCLFDPRGEVIRRRTSFTKQS